MPMRLSGPPQMRPVRTAAMALRRGEKSVQFLDDGCAFPNGAADAFDGAGAHIADSEDPSYTRLVLRSFVNFAA